MTNNSSPYICYGKLPTVADFVSYNAANREIQDLDQWFQEGLVYAKNRLLPNWDLAYRKAPAYGFILTASTKSKILIGINYPSWDKIGRKFPFLMASAVDINSIIQTQIPYLPIRYKNFFEELWIFVQQATRTDFSSNIQKEIESFNSISDPPLNEILENFTDFKNKTTIFQYCTRIWRNFEEQKKYILFENFIALTRSLQRFDLHKLDYGLRIPLGSEFHYTSFEVSFWLELIIKLLPQYSGIPSIFYTIPNATDPAYLFLFFDQPSSKVLAGLIQVDLDIDPIYKLDSNSAESDDKNFPIQVRELLDEPNRNLLDLIDKVVPAGKQV